MGERSRHRRGTALLVTSSLGPHVVATAKKRRLSRSVAAREARRSCADCGRAVAPGPPSWPRPARRRGLTLCRPIEDLTPPFICPHYTARERAPVEPRQSRPLVRCTCMPLVSYDDAIRRRNLFALWKTSARLCAASSSKNATIICFHSATNAPRDAAEGHRRGGAHPRTWTWTAHQKRQNNARTQNVYLFINKIISTVKSVESSILIFITLASQYKSLLKNNNVFKIFYFDMFLRNLSDNLEKLYYTSL